MADYLAYSSTLESNSDRPQCPIPQQEDASRRESAYTLNSYDHTHRGGHHHDIGRDEAELYHMQSANGRRQSVAPIVPESGLAASAAMSSAARPTVARPANTSPNAGPSDADDDDDGDRGGNSVNTASAAQEPGSPLGFALPHESGGHSDGDGDEEENGHEHGLGTAAPSAQLLAEAFTFAHLEEGGATSPSLSPRSPRSPESRRRRRASVSTPFETISEEEDGDSSRTDDAAADSTSASTSPSPAGERPMRDNAPSHISITQDGHTNAHHATHKRMA